LTRIGKEPTVSEDSILGILGVGKPAIPGNDPFTTFSGFAGTISQRFGLVNNRIESGYPITDDIRKLIVNVGRLNPNLAGKDNESRGKFRDFVSERGLDSKFRTLIALNELREAGAAKGTDIELLRSGQVIRQLFELSKDEVKREEFLTDPEGLKLLIEGINRLEKTIPILREEPDKIQDQLSNLGAFQPEATSKFFAGLIDVIKQLRNSDNLNIPELLKTEDVIDATINSVDMLNKKFQGGAITQEEYLQKLKEILPVLESLREGLGASDPEQQSRGPLTIDGIEINVYPQPGESVDAVSIADSIYDAIESGLARTFPARNT